MKNKKKQERIKSYEELTEILAGCVNISKLDKVWKTNSKSIDLLSLDDLRKLFSQRDTIKSGGLIPPTVIATKIAANMLKNGWFYEEGEPLYQTSVLKEEK